MNDKLHQIARDTAACLGATYDPTGEGDGWRAYVTMPDGIRLMFAHTATRGNKPGVYAYIVRQGADGRRESRKVGEIGVSLDTRTPDAIARDIERRLLPDARIAAQNVRDNWARDDSTAADLARIAADLATIPGVTCDLEDGGLRVKGRFYVADRGYLHFDVTRGGNVTFDRVGVWCSNSDQIAALRGVIAALSGAR